jgi:hypothetical protein
LTPPPLNVQHMIARIALGKNDLHGAVSVSQKSQTPSFRSHPESRDDY